MAPWYLILASSFALLAPMAGAQANRPHEPHAGGPAVVGGAAPAGTKVPPAARPAPLLPDAFAGWVAEGPARRVSDAADADGAAARALREYDFTDGEVASYRRDGETLSLRALRFSDASGAYGAYTFYRQSGWPREQIGTGAASNRNRVLFWVGNMVVDATFSRVDTLSASELRELAAHLPVAKGSKALAPPILASLPQDRMESQTTHYALGPEGYGGAGGVLPPSLVGFDHGAEAVTAGYALPSGPATLTLIEYPTPQLAQAQEARIRAYVKAGAGAAPPRPAPLADSDQASLEVRRSGPVVAVVSGDAIPDESHKLIESVHYQEDLVSIPRVGTEQSEVSKTGQLLLGIAELVLIGGVTAILLGLFLGGGRALYRRARGKPVSSMSETEFIRLNLEK